MKAKQSSGLNHTGTSRRAPWPYVIICGVQRNGLAGRRQPATRQRGVICCLQALGTCYGCSRSGRPGSAAAAIACPSQVLGEGWAQAGISWGFLVLGKKQREKRQEPTGQKEAQALLGLDREERVQARGSPGPRADAGLPLSSLARKTSSEFQEVRAPQVP